MRLWKYGFNNKQKRCCTQKSVQYKSPVIGYLKEAVNQSQYQR
jgi:hypothetical protein